MEGTRRGDGGPSMVINGQWYKKFLFEGTGKGERHHHGVGTRDSKWKGQDRGHGTLQRGE